MEETRVNFECLLCYLFVLLIDFPDSQMSNLHPQQSRDVDTMVGQKWHIVVNVEPTLALVSCFVGVRSHFYKV